MRRFCHGIKIYHITEYAILATLTYQVLRYFDGWDLMAEALGGTIGLSLGQGVLSIQVIRLLEERNPLQLQVALGIHALKL